MEKPKLKASPKDFFLHLLNIIMLYISAFAFGNILFTLINFHFPDKLEFFRQELNRESLRWAISSIIIAFPSYVLGARYLNNVYRKDPEKKGVRIKQWLEYFTVFGAAVIILITLMTIINRYLGGELTARFLLKTATVLYIAGTVFGYYYLLIKNNGLEAKR